MAISDKTWRVLLYAGAAVALGLGVVEAIREQRLSAPLAPETQPPAFHALRLDGRPFGLEEVHAKAVLLGFWATWCAPCLREMPTLRKLAADYRSDGLAFVAANVDDPDDRGTAVAQWLREQKGEAPLVVFPTDETKRAWRAGVLPTLYVLGGDGRVVAGYSGARGEATLREAIERALKAP